MRKKFPSIYELPVILRGVSLTNMISRFAGSESVDTVADLYYSFRNRLGQRHEIRSFPTTRLRISEQWKTDHYDQQAGWRRYTLLPVSRCQAPMFDPIPRRRSHPRLYLALSPSHLMLDWFAFRSRKCNGEACNGHVTELIPSMWNNLCHSCT